MQAIRNQLMKLPLCTLCAVGICVLHVTHALIHHTPLDSGALDSGIQQLNLFFTANLNTRN